MNDELNGNRWLDELRAEEADAAPRRGFKDELRNRMMAEWDGAVDSGGDTKQATTQATEAMPVHTIPVQPQRPPSSLAPRFGGASSPKATHIAWQRVAAAAAVITIGGGAFFALTRQGDNNDDDLVVTDSSTLTTTTNPLVTDPVTVPSVATSADTPATPPDASSTIAETTEVTTTTGETAAPKATTTAPPPAPTTTTPASTTTTPKPDGPSLLDNWPNPPAPATSTKDFEYYLPAKTLPGETEVQQSLMSIEPNPGVSTYFQAYKVDSGLLTIATILDTEVRPNVRSTGTAIDTSSWRNNWPSAYYAVAPGGVTRIALTDADGYVVVTGIGLGQDRVTELAKTMTRRTGSAAGWELSAAANAVADGWQDETERVRAIFLSDPDTPTDQIDVTNFDLAMFPWADNAASVEYQEINGQPGAISSSGGVVRVSWLTPGGRGVRFAHKGDWSQAVELARTIQPVSFDQWDARIDGYENRSGHDEGCFFVICDE